jgi:hypothetical protein
MLFCLNRRQKRDRRGVSGNAVVLADMFISYENTGATRGRPGTCHLSVLQQGAIER